VLAIGGMIIMTEEIKGLETPCQCHFVRHKSHMQSLRHGTALSLNYSGTVPLLVQTNYSLIWGRWRHTAVRYSIRTTTEDVDGWGRSANGGKKWACISHEVPDGCSFISKLVSPDHNPEVTAANGHQMGQSKKHPTNALPTVVMEEAGRDNGFTRASFAAWHSACLAVPNRFGDTSLCNRPLNIGLFSWYRGLFSLG